ncbi:formimidoylglutamase [Flavihumibacter sp. R14]|nr:formimidoylglutamase [Flavihumibacter soli]
MGSLRIYNREQILSYTNIRPGEIKLGEKVQVVENIKELAFSSSKFVLLGLPEDVGVQANFGITGSRTAWEDALRALLNIQSTEKLRGDEIAVLGHIDFTDEIGRARALDAGKEDELESLRNIVNEIDSETEQVIKAIYAAGKIPLVVGGGHNNAYPILKAFSESFKRPVNTINIDAHSDFRAIEGRHSGNGFSYAFKEGFLGKYSMIGLHENYNSRTIIDQFHSQPERFRYVFFEDFIRETTSHSRAFQHALDFTDGLCGLEIDLDSISGVLTSAMSPTGFTTEQVRDMIAQTVTRQLFYLHIAEGASRLDDGRESKLTGKVIAYLLSDFIKAQE